MTGLPLQAPTATLVARRLDIDVVHEAGDWARIAAVEDLIRQAASAVAAHGAIDLGNRPSATIALGSDDMVRDLNRRFRGKDKPTNVLSFPAPEVNAAEGENQSLGDIVLALETIEHEAASLGVTVAHHLQHLTVHGLLHLLGFDHQSAVDATEMEGLETEMLASFGVPDPYADSDPLPP